MKCRLALVCASAVFAASARGTSAQPSDGDHSDDDGRRRPARTAASTETGTRVPPTIEKIAPPPEPSEPPPARANDAARAMGAALRSSPVAIDGRIDDAAWATARPQAGFYQRAPHDGQPPRYQTEFRLLYDREALYVAVRAFDDQPDRIVRFLTRRDVYSRSDWLAVSIDSYADRRTAFRFGVNAAGVKLDVLHFNDSEQDPSWDAVWDAAARVDRLGWTAEFRIPYTQLRFSDAPEQTWGLQVYRIVGRTQELSMWSPWPQDSPLEVSRFGTVSGIRDIDAGRRIELLPYAVAGAALAHPDPGDMLNPEREARGKLGLDFKVPLSTGFGLTGTINPDFGQVEADPSQVNLSASEIVLEEKRPFFIEGTDIFRFPLAAGMRPSSATLFYTRRIGAAPHLDAASEADFARAPRDTTIYAAGKLSGKSPGGWSVGLLDAVTGQEDATVVMPSGAGPERLVVEPLTNYGLARVRKDLRGGKTAIGGTVTAVNRSLEGTGLDWLHDQAYTGGFEVNHRVDGGWVAEAKLAGSTVHGAPEAIDRTQRSSQRYFQRPDAYHLDYDPARTSLSGAALAWSFGKVEAGTWRAATGGEARSPGFEINDLGVMHGADFFLPWLWGQHRDDRPGRVLNDHAETIYLWSEWDTAPTFLNKGAKVDVAANLLSLWGAGAGATIHHDRRDPGGLRGGPMLRRDLYYDGFLNLWSDPRPRVHGYLDTWALLAPVSDSRFLSVSPFVAVQARDDLEIALGPTIAASVDGNQYVAEAMGIDGRPHYVMGRIRQITTSLTLRAGYSVSPTLGVQLYAQPFISGGQYLEYEEVADPDAADYGERYSVLAASEVTDMDGVRSVDRNHDGVTDYSFPLADFNLRQLRSNLIVRWEPRPGSTLFLIWSHGRTSQAPDGRYLVSEDLGALAHEPGEHVVLAKLSYWLGL